MAFAPAAAGHQQDSYLRIRTRHFRPMLSACVVTIAAVAGSAAHAAAITPNATVGEQVSTGTSALMTRWSPFVKEASRRFGIAEEWIKAVMRMETAGHTTAVDGKPITSKAGAMGLMQLMPETWHDMQRTYGLGKDPYDPHDNVIAGTAYLRWLYDRFGFPRMFAAYNAGPGTVGEQMAGHRELPQETRGYVSGIARILRGKNSPAAQSLATAAEAHVQAVAVHKDDGPATFTRPDGSKISVDAAAVMSIRTPIANEFAPGVQTVLSMGARFQGVIEKPELVASILRSHGGVL